MKGVIHDLGYARYAGERRSPATLWRVIMRQHLAYAWKGRWRYKPWLGIAGIVTTIVAVTMWIQRYDTMRALRGMGRSIPFIDGALPLAYEYYRWAAFIVTMTIGAGSIARDQESGAFTFYFSRPVRPLDYVLGKLSGQVILMAGIFLVGPILLAAYRVGISDDTADALDQLVLLPKVLAVGTLATLVFASLPLAFSAIAGRRTIALALWAAYYMVATNVIMGIGALAWKPLMAIDPGTAITTVAARLFDLPLEDDALPPMWAAVGSMLLQSALAVVLIVSQVKKHAEGAVGGSS